MSTEADAGTGRVVYLDPRITHEAVMALRRGADERDRFMLRIDPADRGLVHQWTGPEGYEDQQTLDIEVFEVTPMVRQRIRAIREAVLQRWTGTDGYAHLIPSGLVDAESATSWGDLPEDHWQNQALAATQAPAPADRIIMASREPDTDEWIYVRVSPKTLLALRDALSRTVDEGAESGASLAAQGEDR